MVFEFPSSSNSRELSSSTPSPASPPPPYSESLGNIVSGEVEEVGEVEVEGVGFVALFCLPDSQIRSRGPTRAP
jgi:hypothetical protein